MNYPSVHLLAHVSLSIVYIEHADVQAVHFMMSSRRSSNKLDQYTRLP